MAGYSGTPLVKKLGIKESFRIYIHNPPQNFLELIQPLPPGVLFRNQLERELDMIHIFSTSKVELSGLLQKCLKYMNSNEVIWVSWPKKASKMTSDITENTIRDVALPLGLVDIKVCAVNEIWSGLKLVLRKENRH